MERKGQDMSCQKCQGKPASGRLPQNFCLCRQKPFLDMPLGAGVTAIVCFSPCFLPKNSYLSRWMLKSKFHTGTGCFWTSLAELRLHKISVTPANTWFLNNLSCCLLCPVSDPTLYHSLFFFFYSFLLAQTVKGYCTRCLANTVFLKQFL